MKRLAIASLAAAALALSVQVSKADPSTADLKIQGQGDFFGHYTAASAWSSFTGFIGSLTSLYNYAGFSTIYSYFTSQPTVNVVGSGWSSVLGFDVAQATITYAGGSLVPNDTPSAGPTPVPGPLAAAGLPAVLGLMGFAAWRRRKTGAVAA